MTDWRMVSSAMELTEVLEAGSGAIQINGTLGNMAPITLPLGVRLRDGTLASGAKGVRPTDAERMP
jgi:hypothetical protein